MSRESRKTGIEILGDVPSGTHGCLFYDTPQDLLDFLIPFIAAGLENNEACLWVVSEPLSIREALARLEQSITNLGQHLAAQRVELIPRAEWYLNRGRFDLPHLAREFQRKIEAALGRGLSGVRATGDAAWLDGNHRKKVHEYEEHLASSVAAYPAIVLCTYPLAWSSASDLLDASRTHRFTAITRQGQVDMLETPHLLRVIEEAGALKVVKHIRLLRAENDELIQEILERKRVEQELRKQKEILQTIFDRIPVLITFFHGDRIRLVNREWERVLGWTLEEIRQNKVNIVAELYPNPEDQLRVTEFISHSHGEWRDFKTRVRDGRAIDTTWTMVQLSDGTKLSIGRDTTDRKKAEAQLKASTEQLRALSASIQEAREEERSRVARQIHDELGSVLTSLKWDLSSLDQIFPQLPDPVQLRSLRAKISDMLKLVDSTIGTVRRLASELRPRILDDLGLVDAIEWQTQQFETRTGIVCRRDGFSNHLPFSEQQSTAIFRIFQEALTNILRHAAAICVDITIAHDDTSFVLTIRDNGRGIIGVEKSGLGILGMQERARLIGGTIDIRGSEGGGTTISVQVPISDHLSVK